MYVVYALVDPRYDMVRYVGLTNDVYKRFSYHMQCQGPYEKNVWIMELRSLNKMVIMKTLEEVETYEEAFEREAYWIQHFLSIGLPLLNKSNASVARKYSTVGTISPLAAKKVDLDTAVRAWNEGNKSIRKLQVALGVRFHEARCLIVAMKEKKLI